MSSACFGVRVMCKFLLTVLGGDSLAMLMIEPHLPMFHIGVSFSLSYLTSSAYQNLKSDFSVS